MLEYIKNLSKEKIAIIIFLLICIIGFGYLLKGEADKKVEITQNMNMITDDYNKLFSGKLKPVLDITKQAQYKDNVAELNTILTAKAKEAKDKKDWSVGKTDSKVVVESFMDFECPACKDAEETIMYKLMDEYKDKVKFVQKHYPLYQIHKMGLRLSEAAEVAGQMGKFYEYSKKLFQLQVPSSLPSKQLDVYSTANLIKYAKELGLNEADFKSKFESHMYIGNIAADLVDGNNRDLQGTPSIFVNNKKAVTGYETIKKMIEEELAK